VSISKDQASMLRQYSVSDRVIVAVPADLADSQRSLRSAVDLTAFFKRVRLIAYPPGPLLAHPGRMKFLADLSVEMPDTDQQGGVPRDRDPDTSSGIEAQGAGLSP
jgi:hypothetical protein